MRPGMKSGVFQRLSQMLEPCSRVRLIATNPEQAIDRMHAKADGFHVEGGNRASQGLRFLHQLIAMGIGQRRQSRQQVINRGQRRSRMFRHVA